MRLGWGLTMTAVAGLFAAIGGALCLWAIYQYLGKAVDTATAALLTGGVALLIVVVLIWLVKRLTR